MTKKNKMWFYSFTGYGEDHRAISYGNGLIDNEELFSENENAFDWILKQAQKLNRNVVSIHIISLSVIQ